MININPRPRIVGWFSCGDASAVAVSLLPSLYGRTHEIAVARCIVPEEHPDNDRFAADCERWWGRDIVNLRSDEYANCTEVWTRRRYMSGTKGASCTLEMKKAVRWAFEAQWKPDLQAFGFTVEERKRADRFRRQNPDVRLVTPLIDAGLSKDDCHAIVARAGIQLPAMYRLGYVNNNCIGCVKAQSPTYWNRVRRSHPDVFEARAKLSREIGCKLVKGTSGKRERIHLDELDPTLGERDIEPDIECSLLCALAEDFIADSVSA